MNATAIIRIQSMTTLPSANTLKIEEEVRREYAKDALYVYHVRSGPDVARERPEKKYLSYAST